MNISELIEGKTFTYLGIKDISEAEYVIRFKEWDFCEANEKNELT